MMLKEIKTKRSMIDLKNYTSWQAGEDALFSISLRNIRSVSFLWSLELSLRDASFALPLTFSPFLHLLKSCIVSSCCYTYLLIAIETFISLLVLVSIDSDRCKDGGNNDSNFGIFKGVEGSGNTR